MAQQLDTARIRAACRVAIDSCRAAKRIDPAFDFESCVNTRKLAIRQQFAQVQGVDVNSIIDNSDWSLAPPQQGGKRSLRNTRRNTRRNRKNTRKHRR